MNPSTTSLTLNMQLPNIATVAWAVQGDQLARHIEATLVDGSSPWNPQESYSAVIRYAKPDGTKGVYDVDEEDNPAVTWSGNVATITIAQQAITVAGTVIMQLEFYDSNNARLTSFGWAMNVQPSAITDTEFLSTDYYNILSLQIAAILGVYENIPIPSTSNPQMDGTASPGTGVGFSRGDHVHPSDTSRLPISGGTLTGNLSLKSDLTSNSQNPPSSATYGRRMYFYDSAATANGDVYQQYKPDGTKNIEGIGIRAIRNVGGVKSNGIFFGIDQNNNHTVEISDPDAWLAALFGTITPITTYDTIVTVATGFEKPDNAVMYFAAYGKTAQLYFNIKKNSTAITNVNAATNFAQLNSSYRSPFRFGITAIPGTSNSSPIVGYANGNGGLMYIQGPIAADQSFYVCATYLLA